MERLLFYNFTRRKEYEYLKNPVNIRRITIFSVKIEIMD